MKKNDKKLKYMTEGNITKLTIILSVTFYLSSLTQTAYCTYDCKSSLTVFLVGLLGVLTEIGSIVSSIMDKINGQTNTMNINIGATFTWLANPIIVFSLIIFRHSKRTALILSTISSALILLFLVFDRVVDDVAGHYSKVTNIKLGYWLWLFSSLIIMIGSLIITKRKKVDNENKTQSK
jgi:hypothetical protein